MSLMSGTVSFESVLPDNGMSAREALKHGQGVLGSGPDGFREAEILLADLLGAERVALYRDDIRIAGAALEEYGARLSRRAAGEPVHYILGHVDFFGTRVRVGPGVLIPRPETELWLAELLDRRALFPEESPRRIVDLCTGSGCLALELSRRFPGSQILAVDCSEQALGYAKLNVQAREASNISLIRADLLSFLRPGRFAADLLVCNPPYVAASDYAGLEPTVREWEPAESLLGGEDGLDYYRKLSVEMAGLLSPGGVAAFEIGAGQGPAVTALLRGSGMRRVSVFTDYAGHDRAVFGVWPGE